MDGSNAQRVIGQDGPAIVALIQQSACERLAGIVSDPEQFRQDVRYMDLATLVGNFSTLDKLVDMLAASQSPAGELSLPTIADLRGICAVEGTGRGVILSAGEHDSDNLVAQLLADRLLGVSVVDSAAD